MKAIGLISGGLDSALALKLILDQGIEVIAVNFKSPFCLCDQKGKCFSAEIAKKLKLPLKVIYKGEDYLKIIRNPKHGYGKNMNPCIDCRIYMLNKTKQYAKKIGAKFIFTGEVLDQRPMSQHLKAMKIIEKETNLQILRPLSAKLLEETEAEKKGWVDRNKLLDLRGKTRTPQIALAKKLKINDYACPAGGCLLTQKDFANKLKDLFKHKKKVTMKDIELLKLGRHFRYKNNKIIVGRNEKENNQLMKQKKDYIFEVPDCGSPITILKGNNIKLAAELTASYSDSKNKTKVKYGKEKLLKEITVNKIDKEKFIKLRI